MKNFAECMVFSALILLCISVEVPAVVLHSVTTPPPDWTEHPPDNVVGRWGTNASCVVIGPNVIITTCHQNGYEASSTSPVVINGTTYTVKDVYVPPSGSDIRICTLNDANFSDYVGIYDSTQELGKLFVIGGYGRGRGANLYTDGTVYGYQWASEANTTLRWGENKIRTVYSTYLYLDFDGPQSSNATQYECTVAEYDSGCGWFLNDNGQWKLIGITFSASASSANQKQSWFKNPNTLADQPDLAYAHRINYYAEWIEDTLATIPPPPPPAVEGDINGDGVVNGFDLSVLGSRWLNEPCSPENNWCEESDINEDGSVTIIDMVKISEHWSQ